MADKAPKKRVEKGPPMFGVMGYFTTPKDLYHACEELRDAGYTKFDAHTPFPVHGLEKAIGLPPSKLPFIVLGGGATGLASAIALTWWTQGVDYPLNVAGKPPFAFPAFVPIMFELTVLFSAFACFFGMWGLNRLPMPSHPVFKHPSWPRATDDAFFVAIESDDPKYDPARTKAMLEKLGAQEVMEIEA
jgi:hypothetical protein